METGGNAVEHPDTIRAVQRMQDYMETHIGEPITLADLARAAGYSQWHSARIFKSLVGKSPFEYLRALRLSRAAVQLRCAACNADADGGRARTPRVMDVALDFVFDSHEGFTRAFSRQFGLSPREFRRRAGSVELFMPHRVRDYYIQLQRGEIQMAANTVPKAKTVFVQVVERPARKAIIKRGIKATHYFEYCEEVGCDVWEVLSGIEQALHEPAGMWLPPSMIRPGTSKYVQGVEVSADYNGPVPDGFEVIELPACKIMVFQGEPFKDEDFSEAIGDLWETINRYDPQVYGFEWADDDAPRFQLAPLGYRGYIEGRPVRQCARA